MPDTWKNFESFFETRNVKNNAARLIPYVEPNSKIIDVGCGSGTITRDFARRAPEGSVVGVDHSEESIATAKAQAKKEGLTNVEFFVGDVEHLGQFHDNTFDMAHAHQVMLHLVHPVKSLSQVRRLLKPGGVVGIRDLISFHQPGATDLMNQNWEQLFEVSRRDRGTHGSDAGTVHHIWMHEAGFAWDKIDWGSVALEYPKAHFPALKQGHMDLAAMRRESEDYMKRLSADWDDYLVNPAARNMILDGWVIGTK